MERSNIVLPPLFKNKNSSPASAILWCNFQRVRTEKYIVLLLQVALLSIEKNISQVYSRSLLYRIKPPFLASAKNGQEGPGVYFGKTGERCIIPYGT